MVHELPWLFYFPDAALAAEVAPALYAEDAVVIADPDHVPDHLQRRYLHTVQRYDQDPDNLAVFIHDAQWAFPAGYEQADPSFTAANILGIADDLVTMFPSPADLPEGTPQRVIDWIEYEDDDGDE